MGARAGGPSTPTRTVLVIDDRSLPRLAMKAMLADSSEFRLVGEASTGREGIRLAKELRPDIVLLDVEMPGESGPDTARAIIGLGGWTPAILAWTVSDSADDLIMMMRAGCSGYILKDVGPQELFRAVDAATRGDTPVPRRLIPEVIQRAPAPQPAEADVSGITPREIAVIRALARGFSSKEIGRNLGISKRSVETHLSNIYRKLGVSSRGQAVRSALQRRIIEFDDFYGTS